MCSRLWLRFGFMLFNATFNNISAMPWRSAMIKGLVYNYWKRQTENKKIKYCKFCYFSISYCLICLSVWWCLTPLSTIFQLYRGGLICNGLWEERSGAEPGVQVRGAPLKKLRRAEAGAKIFWIFRVKNHDFMPKNLIFSQF